MSEKIPSIDSSAALVQAVARMRESTLTSPELHAAWLDAVYVWDKALKSRITERFGSTALLQEVAAWQTLVGGTVEPVRTLTPEARHLVEGAIRDFLRDFADQHHLA